MKLSDSISKKKSLVLMGLYLVILIIISYILKDFFHPLKNDPVFEEMNNYKQSLKEDPDNPQLYSNLGGIYFEIATKEEHEETGYLKKTAEQYEKAVELSPENINYNYQLGLAYEYLGEMNKAKNQYEIVLTMEPLNVVSNYKLGLMAQQNKEYEKAIKHYLNVLKIEPTSADIYYELGRIYEEMSESQKAIAMYEEVIKYIPDYTDVNDRIKQLAKNESKGTE
jgi:tetratricopeptide (TPR) repeat protein